MNRQLEATKILDAVIAGNFLMRTHADQRRLQRSISMEEIARVARTSFEWRWQESKQTHLFIGYRDAEMTKGGGFSAVMDESGAVIVTIFKRRLRKKKETGK
jgi:hypothetical protein